MIDLFLALTYNQLLPKQSGSFNIVAYWLTTHNLHGARLPMKLCLRCFAGRPKGQAPPAPHGRRHRDEHDVTVGGKVVDVYVGVGSQRQKLRRRPGADLEAEVRRLHRVDLSPTFRSSRCHFTIRTLEYRTRTQLAPFCQDSKEHTWHSGQHSN